MFTTAAAQAGCYGNSLHRAFVSIPQPETAKPEAYPQLPSFPRFPSLAQRDEQPSSLRTPGKAVLDVHQLFISGSSVLSPALLHPDAHRDRLTDRAIQGSNGGRWGFPRKRGTWQLGRGKAGHGLTGSQAHRRSLDGRQPGQAYLWVLEMFATGKRGDPLKNMVQCGPRRGFRN